MSPRKTSRSRSPPSRRMGLEIPRRLVYTHFALFAGVMELADVLDSKSNGLTTRAGSTPAAGTIRKSREPDYTGVRDFFFVSVVFPFIHQKRNHILPSNIAFLMDEAVNMVEKRIFDRDGNEDEGPDEMFRFEKAMK